MRSIFNIISCTFWLSDFNYWFWGSKILLQFSKYYLNIIYSCVPCTCFKHFPPMEFIVQNKEMHVWATIVFTSFEGACPHNNQEGDTCCVNQSIKVYNKNLTLCQKINLRALLLNKDIFSKSYYHCFSWQGYCGKNLGEKLISNLSCQVGSHAVSCMFSLCRAYVL